MSDIFNLTCESASNLGGPIGTTRPLITTSHVYTKPFGTLIRAKAHAEGSVKNWPIWAEWRKSGDAWVVDCGSYIFTIKKEKVQ